MNFEHVLGCFLGSERGEVDKMPMCKDTWKMCFPTHYLQYIVAVGHFRKLAKSEQKSPKTPQTTCSKFMLFLKKSTKNRPNSTTKTCSPKCCSKSPFWDPFGVDLGHLGAPRPPQETPPRPPKSDPRAAKYVQKKQPKKRHVAPQPASTLNWSLGTN